MHIGDLITRTPGVHGGRPCISGTRVPVHDVAGYYREGMTPERVWEEFPQLDLADVFAALACYLANQPEIDGYIAADFAAANAKSKRGYGGRDSGPRVPRSHDVRDLIDADPSPSIAGTRIRVRAVAARYNAGVPARELGDHFPGVPLAAIYGALAHYFANKAAIDSELAEGDTLYARLARRAR